MTGTAHVGWAQKEWRRAAGTTYYLSGKGPTDLVGFQEALAGHYAREATTNPDKGARRRFARLRDEAQARAEALRKTRAAGGGR